MSPFKSSAMIAAYVAVAAVVVCCCSAALHPPVPATAKPQRARGEARAAAETPAAVTANAAPAAVATTTTAVAAPTTGEGQRLSSSEMPMMRAQTNSTVQGLRECTAKEKRRAACLAGECVALHASSVNTYVICRCPMNRAGKRCEERSLSHDVVTWMAKRLAALPLQVRCESQNVNMLAKQGFESSLAECVKYQAGKRSKVKDSTGQPPAPAPARRRTAAAAAAYSAIRAIFGLPNAATASGGSSSKSASSSAAAFAALLWQQQHRRPTAATAAPAVASVVAAAPFVNSSS